MARQCLLTIEPNGPILRAMIGRPKQFDEVTALMAALELFWRRGYKATSLDDLLGVMSISKSSFYAQYESKEVLYRRCLQAYRDAIVNQLTSVLQQSDTAALFFQTLFDDVVQDAATDDPRGCLIVNSAAEFGQHEKAFTEDVRAAFASIQQVFESAVRQGIKSGEFSSRQSPSVTSKYITATLSGLRMMIKGGMSPKEARAVATRLLDSLSV